MNNPHIKEGQIKYTKGYGWKYMLSKFIDIILTLIPLILMIIVTFIYVKQPIRTVDGYVTPENVTIKYKEIPIGETVVTVDDTKVHYIFQPLENAIITKEISTVTIVAGPYGEVLENSDGSIAIKSIEGTFETNLSDIDNEYLDSEYVVRDSAGNDKIIDKHKVVAKSVK